VAPETLTLLASMIEAWELTGGRYDPGILPLLIANGYATSRIDPGRITALSAKAQWIPGSVLDVTLDLQRSTATLPVGLALDAGGIGKGLAADLSVARLLAGGAAGALVSIGGDLAMAGIAPQPNGWVIGIEHADPTDGVLCTLALNGGGVATSSTVSRRWHLNGTSRHHAIDTATNRQSTTDLAAVTVIAGTGWAAEAHATAALLAGSADVIDYLTMRGLSGLAITTTGAVVATADLRALPLGLALEPAL
jgi:thiamine biosynthesis lipoprotein